MVHSTAGSALTELRIDLWLWKARFFKSRALSTKVVKLGKIRLIRGTKTTKIHKPNTQVRVGDQLTFFQGSSFKFIKITGLPTRRGPASEAQLLYCLVDEDAEIQLRA